MQSSNILAVILGGGRGTRLFPLTLSRSKPAVPLGGKYRLVDIPISNCINSNIKKMFILTQFNTASLHMHINRSFSFDIFSNGYVDILAAEQTMTSDSWYEGTADAVRKNLQHFVDPSIDYVIILSGDQLYRMNYREILKFHIENKADITVSVLPVEEEKTHAFGILKVNKQARITDFIEKTKDPKKLADFRIDDFSFFPNNDQIEPNKKYLASMGIYVFNREVLNPVLANDMVDFGKHIIPASIDSYNVFAYPFCDYWEDIGTIGSFYEANLNLTKEKPDYDFFDLESPIYTHPRFLPPTRHKNCTIVQSSICEGCNLNGSKIEHSVIGIRTTVRENSQIKDCIIMGQDYYQNGINSIPLGIGKGCKIERTIIDKNASIGDGTVITSKKGCPNEDHENYYVRDGIVIIPKHAVIKPGTII